MNNDLDKRQIAWQDWRNNLYAEMQRAARQAHNSERANQHRLPIIAKSIAPQRSEKYITDAEEDREWANRSRDLYEQAVTLDTTLKNARYHLQSNADKIHEQSYLAALEACEKFMQDNKSIR